MTNIEAAQDRVRRIHNERIARMERDVALALKGAEPLMNGRCVGHVEYDERVRDRAGHGLARP